MSKFERSFPASWMAILEGRPGWWQDLLDCRFEDESGTQRPLLLAVRKDYLNAYVEGQSVMKIAFPFESLRAEIHHKYLRPDVENIQILHAFDGVSVDGIKYRGNSTLQDWMSRAQRFARKSPKGSEKPGVAVVVGRNPHVIDVEMAFENSRIDMVALERDGLGIKIVFYEAKLFSNPSLRARSLRPSVLEQMSRYEEWLSTENRAAEVTLAYWKTCKLLVDLRRMQNADPIDDLIVEASKDGSKLSLDPKPRLVIFGKDNVGADRFWPPHEQALRQAGLTGNRLIIKPRAKDVRLPRDVEEVVVA